MGDVSLEQIKADGLPQLGTVQAFMARQLEAGDYQAAELAMAALALQIAGSIDPGKMDKGYVQDAKAMLSLYEKAVTLTRKAKKAQRKQAKHDRMKAALDG